jgi:phosphoribosyl-ATP pyrophosphohydrolase/phosphoribosyl-AMP cyclohydrolase
MSDFIAELAQVIEDRKANPRPQSYTNKLLADPVEAAKKVGEEGTEVAIASLVQSDERLLDETADLVYHTLILLSVRGLSWEQVLARLEARHR